ncbi:MAG: hypothetical protein HYR98_00975 [Nitrospirae bacterium]|nr:hypothetical protein [Nitrospirota bacterium]
MACGDKDASSIPRAAANRNTRRERSRRNRTDVVPGRLRVSVSSTRSDASGTLAAPEASRANALSAVSKPDFVFLQRKTATLPPLRIGSLL